MTLGKIFRLLALFTVWSAAAYGQSTTVTGTIVDPNTNAYANGTVSAQTVPTNGQAIQSTTPAALSGSGFFSIVIPSNTYIFTFCASPVNIGPLGNVTPQQVCFQSGVLVIAGGSMDISATVNPLAKVIGPRPGSTSSSGCVPAGPVNGVLVNNGGGCANGIATDNGTVFGVNGDMTNLGPNPYFNIANYGAYSSFSPATAVCSITAASPILACASNPDFINGQGVVVPKAGAATVLATPPQPTVTPTNVNGATTYNYQLIAEDRTGGLTAAGTTGTTTTGATTLGLNTLTLNSCVITDGTTGVIGGAVATYTSVGNHNLLVGTSVDVEGFTGGVFDTCNGTVTVVTTPTGTTFTAFKGQVGAETNTTGAPTGKVYGCNELTFAASSVAVSTQIRYWIYRNSVLVGVQPGLDPHYIDCGLTVGSPPAYIPSSPPGATQPGYLVSTIVSGGGTLSMTLANSAVTTAASQTTLHDNVPALRQAIQAAYSSGGGTIYIPNGGAYPFNSLFDGTTGFINVFTRSIRILFNNNFSTINQPWVLRGAVSIEGDPHETTSFQYIQGPRIAGTAHPMVYVLEGASGIYLKRIQLNSSQVLQTAFMTDEGADGGAVTGIVFDDVSLVGGNGNSKPLIIRGGFDFQWTRGVCSMQGTSVRPSYCITFSRSSIAVTGSTPANAGQIIGRVKFEKVFLDSSGTEIDCRGSSTGSFANSFIFNGSLFENMSMPYLKITGCATSQFSSIQINNLDIADNATGCVTPVVDAAFGGISSLSFSGGGSGCGQPAAFITTSGSAAFQSGAYSRNPGNVDRVIHLAGSQTNTRAFYPLTVLAAPAVAVSAGGGVPVGTIPYTVVAVDIDSNETAVSAVSNCVTTPGNQTCTITAPTLPAGAIGWAPYRSGARANIPGCSFILAGVNYTDTFGFTCGQTAQANGLGFSLAGQTVLGPNGISSPNIRLMSNGFSSASSFGTALSANRTYVVPNGDFVLPMVAVLVTTAAATDNVTVQGMTASGHCHLTPTNANAATDSAGTFVSAKTTNQITVTHPANAGRNWDVFCSAN